MNIAEWGEDLGVGGLLVFAPVIFTRFYFTVTTIRTNLRKVLCKEPVSPVAWYD
jgi:hypothetical protein